MKNDGNILSIDFLVSRGFSRETIPGGYGDDEEIMYIKDGITIYCNDMDGDNCSFSFATYVRGDGRFKGGFTIETETQLENLYFSLTNRKLNEIGSQEDIKYQIEIKEKEIIFYNEIKLKYPNGERSQSHCDVMITDTKNKLDELYLLINYEK
jgi:hypothetical protein